MKMLVRSLALAALTLVAASGCVLDTTYTSCNFDVDCDVGESCFEITTALSFGEFCSYACNADTDCESNLGFPGLCIDITTAGGGNSICYQECIDDFDCFATSVCVDVIDSFDGSILPACVPDN